MEDMDGKWVVGMILGAILTMFYALPLFFPEIAIGLAAIGWPIFYGWMFVKSLSFDAARDLPLIASPVRDIGTLFVSLVLVIGLGFFRGPLGLVTQTVVWVPYFLYPAVAVMLGIGVPYDWTGYKTATYNMRLCEDHKDWSENPGRACAYTPIAGHKLPSFIEDEDRKAGTEKIIRVTPWGPRT